MHVDHLHGGELLQDGARRDPASGATQPRFQGHLQTVGQERHEEVRFNAACELMMDRAQRQVAFEFFEGLCEIVEEHLELRVEEVAPARGEMIEERRLVRHKLVMAGVEAMDLRERKISASADPRGPCAQTNAGAAATCSPDR